MTLINIEKIIHESSWASGFDPLPLYIEYGEEHDTYILHSKKGKGRYLVTGLIRRNTEEEIEEAVRRWLSM